MSDTVTVYSFSRLNSFHDAINGDGCLYGWYKTYIEGDRGIGNYFSEYGTLFHNLIEKLHKSELMLWDIEDEIRKGLASFEFKAPFAPMKKSYENAIREFFNDFDNIFADYQVQQAEEEKTFNVDNVSVRGFPDLIGQHKKYGMIIGDYKSSKPYVGGDLKQKQRQMYLYSIPFQIEYGYLPDYLLFMFVREKSGNRELPIKFDMKELEHTKQWVVKTVEKIESFTGEWTPKCTKVDGSSDFYACHLCNHRTNCEYRYAYTNNDPFKDVV